MSDTKPNFDRQNLTVENSNWTVELYYEGEYLEDKHLNDIACDKEIELNEASARTGLLKIITLNKKNNETKTFLIIGIDGGLYLHTANEKNNNYSIKLTDNFLICSLGFTFLSFDIPRQEIKWQIKPDFATIFEFYDLDSDFLVRGELEIHRIDKEGNIKWSYGGRDIWVNIDGKEEVRIEDNKILLTDFESNEYVINFDSQTLDDKPKVRQIQRTKKWWEIW